VEPNAPANPPSPASPASPAKPAMPPAMPPPTIPATSVQEEGFDYGYYDLTDPAPSPSATVTSPAMPPAGQPGRQTTNQPASQPAIRPATPMRPVAIAVAPGAGVPTPALALAAYKPVGAGVTAGIPGIALPLAAAMPLVPCDAANAARSCPVARCMGPDSFPAGCTIVERYSSDRGTCCPVLCNYELDGTRCEPVEIVIPPAMAPPGESDEEEYG
jgi:hypothetical protein